MAENLDEKVKGAVLEINGSKKTLLTTKRLSFDIETIKRIEMMLPLYADEFDDKLNESEKFATLIQIAVKNLFKTDFADKMKNFS